MLTSRLVLVFSVTSLSRMIELKSKTKFLFQILIETQLKRHQSTDRLLLIEIRRRRSARCSNGRIETNESIRSSHDSDLSGVHKHWNVSRCHSEVSRTDSVADRRKTSTIRLFSSKSKAAVEILDPNYVCDAIVHALRTNQRMVMLPPHTYLFYMLKG